MSIKHIALHVDDESTFETRMHVAMALAKQHEASITGIFVVHLPDIPPFIAAEVGPELQDQYIASAREQAARRRQQFIAAMEEAGIPYAWQELEGGVITEMVHAVRTADLCVVSQPADGASGFGLLPDSLVLESGRPILVVPSVGDYPEIGQRVLVAWNGTRESARAVNDAMPLLTAAPAVDLVSMIGDEEPEESEDAAIESHLARHGVEVHTNHYHPSHIDAGEMLISRAADLGTDLIVMGGYGHSRLREWVLGGATRSVLEHMTVPVFMSH